MQQFPTHCEPAAVAAASSHGCDGGAGLPVAACDDPGLFGWQRMVPIMRLCSLSKQTGTVSVERVWLYYETEFPPDASQKHTSFPKLVLLIRTKARWITDDDQSRAMH